MKNIPTLFPFQKVGVLFGTRVFKGRIFLADDCGLGKTTQSLHIAEYFRDKSPIIVVCPNSVKYGWEVEIHKHTGHHCWILNGLTPPTRTPLHCAPIIVLNWDILRGWVNFLKLLRPKVIIADEVHAIKDRKAQRSKAFRQLCSGVPYIIMLSGTPVENNPIEFFNPLNILRKDLFPSFTKFAFEYTNPKRTFWGMKYEGARNTEQLHELLTEHVMLRRTKREVLTDLPPIQRSVVPFQFNQKEWKKYRFAQTKFLTWMAKHHPGKVKKVQNAVQLAKLSYLLGLVAKLKLPYVIEWIQEFLDSTDKKLVVFGHHRSFLEAIHNHFPDSVLVYGGVKGRKRQAAIDRFADDKNIRLFVGSITAAGTGINRLQTVSSDVVFGELIWVGMKLLQAEGRLHRMGQKAGSVSAHYLITKNTVESILCKAIFKKQEIVNAIVEGNPEQQEFDVFGDVVSELRKERKKK